LAKLQQVKPGTFFGTQCRNIALSYGVDNILTDDYSVLSQSTSLTDGQTDL